MFMNDRFRQATTSEDELQQRSNWKIEITRECYYWVSIGANATIRCGLTIGEGATVGARAVVT